MKLPITVLVQTKNEELGIAACLSKLGDFDEVIVVDSNSDDNTVSIATRFGVRIEVFNWNGQYPKKKQWQLENIQTSNQWVFFLDADESPSPELIFELREKFSSESKFRHDAFDVPLAYVFAGKELRRGHTVFKRVLLRKDKANFPVVNDQDLIGMGELEGHYQPQISGTVGQLRGRLLHNDLDPVSTWIGRHNKYSDWEAAIRLRPEVRSQVASAKTQKGRIFDIMPLKPFFFFCYSYLLRFGFLDGRAGFDYAFGLAWYYWLIGLKERELKRVGR